VAKPTAKQRFSLRAAAQRLAKSASYVWKELSPEHRAGWRQKAANQITPADELKTLKPAKAGARYELMDAQPGVSAFA
jgi:hypothetical protein